VKSPLQLRLAALAFGASLLLLGAVVHGGGVEAGAARASHAWAGAALSVALQLVVFSVLAREIRSRRRAELALGRERTVLRSVLDSIADGVVVVDEQGRFLLFNPAAEKIVGMGATDAKPSEWSDRYGAFLPDGVTPFPPEELPLARAMRGETVRDVEVVVRNAAVPQGVAILHSAAPVLGEDGRAHGGVVVLRDVTARKQAEQDLRAYAEEVSDLYHRAPCGYHSLDEHGAYVRVNDAELRWLGYAREEVLGRCILEFLTPESRSLFQRNFPRFRSLGRVSDLEFEMVRKDGSTFTVLLGATAEYGPDGRFLASRSAMIDITERKRAEQGVREARDAAEAANRELEAFSYSVSHDLRAPLRAIDGFSQALLEDCADRLGAQGRDHLQRVRAGAQRMGRLIDDLLALSRIHRAELKRESVDLSALAREVGEALSRAEPERAVELRVEDRITTTGDPGLLRVVLENLIGNAWKFTRPKGGARIEFGSEIHDGVPVYFVRDNGAGFDMAYVAKLFGPFQRLHSGRDFEGTGIGLATVARVVRRHGGRVWAEAFVQGGATFRFTLAAEPGQQRRAA